MKTFILILLACSIANAKQIKIAIVDTGVNNSNAYPILCKDGLIDLTGEGIQDDSANHHGTNIAGIITKNMRLTNADYCVYIIKAFPTKGPLSFYDYSLQAFKKVVELKPDIVNYSAAGPETTPIEKILVKQMVESNIKVVVAAGNEGKDLDKDCSSYPACLPGVIAVGNLKDNGSKNSSSNTGAFLVWEVGTDVCAGGACLTGTSQATAVRSSKIAKEMSLK